MSENVLSKPRVGIYTAITNKIIDAIQSGPGQCRCPWHGPGIPLALPTNAATLAEYRGINVLALWVDALSKGYPTGAWATYKQWQNIGAQVRQGERGSLIVFYKQIELTPLEGQDPDQRVSRRYFGKASWVFNAAQVDGYEAPPAQQHTSQITGSAYADAFLEAVGATVHHGFPMARYRPDLDEIEMPSMVWFVGTPTSSASDSYYAVRFHETIHWSGASHRLNRVFGRRFGDDAYAMEELVAELGAAFGCAATGLVSEPRADHAAYIATWLKVLKADNRAIFTAASAAQEALEYLIHRAQKNDASNVEVVPV